MKKLRTYSLLLFTIGISIFACTKQASEANPDGTTLPVVVKTGLTISQSLNQAIPNYDLEPSIIYTPVNQDTIDFKQLPVGYNDNIKSFVLPKGYMVVFAENQNGTGESICYVASVSDVKENLPSRLLDKVSFVRFSPIKYVSKKGVCLTNITNTYLQKASWFYNWGLGASSTETQQYVPMTWGKNSANLTNVLKFISRRDIDHLLSFNEPDNANQSNITSIDSAVSRYKIVLQTGLRMGSPAVEQDNSTLSTDWLPKFINSANAQQARIDFIPLHWYDWGNQTVEKATDQLTADAVLNRFKNYVAKLHSAYPDKALWFTEYNCNPARSEAVHKIFMKASAEYLNSVPYVERYAYFFPSKYPISSGVPDYNLTDLGQTWSDIVSTPAFSSNIIPK